jgi:DNA end-binding protein Ku
MKEEAGTRRSSAPRRLLPYTFPMRTTWNGSISFGLVNIPVGLAPATAASARQSDVQFKLLHRECLAPIKQKRWCPVHDIELSPDEIVRGWEVAKGQYVPVEDAELEALETYDTSRSIEIRQFVPAADVDPVYFDRSYFLVPAATEAQRRPYALLVEAMREAAVFGIGAFVLAGKEKLCLIRPKGQALVLETLFLAEDVRSQEEIDEPMATTGVKKEELALAKQIISGLEGSFDPAELRSDYRAKLRGLLEAKLEGHELPEVSAPEEDLGTVVDLMEALRASVAASKGSSASKGGESKATNRRKRTTAAK